MDNILLDFSYIAAVVIEIGLPLFLAIYMWKKYRVSWAIFFLGMLLFLISLIRLPLNNIISSFILKYFVGDLAIALIYLSASFTAGLFEEGVRVLAFGAIIRKRNFKKGIMYGIGHGGGGESMIFVGFLVLINFIAYRFFPEIIPSYFAGEIYDINWYIPLIGAMERIFAIVIQISLSVMVVSAFIRRKYYLITAAVFYHMLVDFISVYAGYMYGIMVSETLVFIFAVISAFIIYILRPCKLNDGRLSN
ncbi:MAG: YhfC family glutamic-type intramembrane protease [Actinomycetota bacterium]|nr:YhfC family glutamic-type intramembrane protease [Actinomycetota bacterium]